MNKKLIRIIGLILLLGLVFTGFSKCTPPVDGPDMERPPEMIDPIEEEIPEDVTEPEPTEAATEDEIPPEATEAVEPLDIVTTGGVVLVGTICRDDIGWYLEPEQPLNVEFTYFPDEPSYFTPGSRINLFDPADDGIDKSLYLGHLVTIHGSFAFYRSFFDQLYLSVYSFSLGKTVESSYAAPELLPPDPTQSKYDESLPLPEYMTPVVENGRYVYNPYMLSKETLQLVGNDFIPFYHDFIDALMHYTPQLPCPDQQYAELLSTILYYETPLYSACAADFEYIKHYDKQTGMITIPYLYDQQEHQAVLDRLMESANTMLATTSPDQTQTELARNIYHELCIRMDYNYAALEDLSLKPAHYAYLEHNGVCITFAVVYNQLLTQVGIETQIVYCELDDTMNHAWSMILINDTWYFCDPTFELSFADGTAYRNFGMSYGERLAEGLGATGFTCGRYYATMLDASMVSDTPIQDY